MKTSVTFEKNSFDILRYYAAFAVMLLHFTGYFLMLADGANTVIKGIRAAVLFFPGVVVLFTISGFLIAASYEKCESRKEFGKKRILRLFPELWVCTALNLLVLSLLAWRKFDSSMIIWLITQVFGIANTPDCLKDFATGSVNGALWTIFVELQLYVVTMVLYPYLKKLSVKLWMVVLAVALLINLGAGFIAPVAPGIVQKLLERTFLPYGLWFFAGMFCYCQRDKILPVLKKLSPVLLILYVICYRIDVLEFGYYCNVATSILCPFIVIGLAYLLPAFRIRIDLTYGMFLYHWIVLNVLVHFAMMKQLHFITTLLLFIGVTLLLAWFSTRFVGIKIKKK